MAEISVIVPVYKVEPYIHRCLDSILAQTYDDFELILVDDGSPDNCGAICDAYAEKDSRIHVIHQKNGGLSAARNTGIDWVLANSDSGWITFIDSDDWIHPDMIAALYRAATENGVKVSMCGFANTYGETPEVPQNDYEVKLYAPDDFLTSVAWAKLYHKSCFETVRYPVGKLHEDEYTTYRILFQLDRFAVLDIPFYFYFQNQNGIMRSVWTPRRLDAVQARKEQTDFFKKNGFERAYHLTAVDYFATILKNRENIRNSDLERRQKRKYSGYLLRCLRKASWDYRDIYMKHEHGVYLEAYPALTWVYRNAKKLMGR